MFKYFSILLLLISSETSTAQGMLDDFETASGFPWAPWVGTGGLTTASSQSPTHSFTGAWTYRTDYVCGYAGEIITMWSRAGTGRSYLGFGASPAGCWSFVMAPNTSDIRFQTNTGYGYLEMTITPYVFTANNWYKMEIEFLTGIDLIGRLYDSDGVTLLATVSQSLPGFVPNGFALRTFSANMMDDLESTCLAVILPVELTRFSGNTKVDRNQLNWVVKSELNNDYFVLEHSFDGENWSKLSDISSVGNSSIETNYFWDHYRPSLELNYYRLSQVDLDGKTEILDIISIDNRIELGNITGIYDLLGRKLDKNNTGIRLIIYDSGEIRKVVGPVK